MTITEQRWANEPVTITTHTGFQYESTRMRSAQIRTSAINGMPHPIREYVTRYGVQRFLPPRLGDPRSRWVWERTDDADSDYAQRIMAAVIGFMARTT